MTTVRLCGKVDEALKEYAEKHCLNIHKFITKLVKEKLEKEGIIIGKSDDPIETTVKSD